MTAKGYLKPPRIPGRGLVWMLVALLIWVPLPYASYLESSWGPLEMGAFVILLVWLLRRSTGVRLDFGRPSGQGLILVLMILWLVFTLFQTLPLPPEVLGYLSPTALADYRATGLFDEQAWHPISLDAGSTQKAFLLYSAYVAVFFVTLKLADNEAWVRIIIFTIIGMATAEAIWGLSEQILTYPHATRANGTFHNPNHFAGFMELALGLSIGLLVSYHKPSKKGNGLGGRLLGWIDWLFSGKLAHYLVSLLLLIALFQSGSRAGVFSTVLGLFFVGLISSWRGVFGTKEGVNKVAFRKRRIAITFILLTIIAIWLGAGDHLTKRIQKVSTQGDGRAYYRQGTLSMFLDAWPTGYGAGVWPHAFDAYRPADSYEWRFWPEAHNEYLQLLSEEGVVGFSLLAGVLMVALLQVARNISSCSAISERALSLGVLIGVLSLLIHSWWDYQFHIPANAVYFFILLALGLKASTTKQTDPNR